MLHQWHCFKHIFERLLLYIILHSNCRGISQEWIWVPACIKFAIPSAGSILLKMQFWYSTLKKLFHKRKKSTKMSNLFWILCKRQTMYSYSLIIWVLGGIVQKSLGAIMAQMRCCHLEEWDWGLVSCDCIAAYMHSRFIKD